MDLEEIKVREVLINKEDIRIYKNMLIEIMLSTKNMKLFNFALLDKRVMAICSSLVFLRKLLSYKEVGKFIILYSQLKIDWSAENNVMLIDASHFGLTEIVNLLISDINVNPAARNNEPLVRAAISGSNDVIRLLIGIKKVRFLEESNSEALKSACRAGMVDSAIYLVDNYEVVNMENIGKVIESAATYRQSDVILKLFSHISDKPVFKSNNVLKDVVSVFGDNSCDVVKELILCEGIDPSFENNYCLHLAVYSRNKELVKILLGENISCYENWDIKAMLKNVDDGFEKIIDLLVLEIKAHDEYIVDYIACAVKKGEVELFNKIMSIPKLKINDNSMYEKLFNIAIKNNDINMVKSMFDYEESESIKIYNSLYSCFKEELWEIADYIWKIKKKELNDGFSFFDSKLMFNTLESRSVIKKIDLF